MTNQERVNKIKTKGIDPATTVRLVDTYSRTYEVIAK